MAQLVENGFGLTDIDSEDRLVALLEAFAAARCQPLEQEIAQLKAEGWSMSADGEALRMEIAELRAEVDRLRKEDPYGQHR